MRKITSLYLVLILCTVTMLAPQTVWSQETEETSTSNWRFQVKPYVLLPYMNGNAAIKGIPVKVDADPGDIFSQLQFGGMLFAEAANDRWAVNIDLLYMDLEADGSTPLQSRSAEVGMSQLGLAISGLFNLGSGVEFGLGGRYNSISSDIRIAPGEYILPGTDFSITEGWFDPLLIARLNKEFAPDWRFGLWVDAGGFGIGSDFAWQIHPDVGYRFSDLFELAFSWRWIGMDYETGSGTERFSYDMIISGPEFSFSFDF